ncbi:hypothetical protein PAMP_006446 [Pampus punctatissimus]
MREKIQIHIAMQRRTFLRKRTMWSTSQKTHLSLMRSIVSCRTFQHQSVSGWTLCAFQV